MFRVLFLILTLMSSVLAEAQIYREVELSTQVELSDNERLEIRSLMSCQIEENFELYVDHLVESIFPRVSKELSSLIRPSISLSGERVQVAESIDSGDLFHVHVRMPLAELSLHPIPFGAYLDSNVYHLQYHSFERLDVIKTKWIRELRQIQDTELQGWLDLLEEHEALVDSQSDPGVEYYNYVEVESPIDESLSDAKKDRFSNLMYKHLNSSLRASEDYKLWLLGRLKTRLNFLDPLTIRFDNLFSQSRSVVSTGYEFLIIKPTNLLNHEQFANIYFEERDDMSPEFETLVLEAEGEGFSHFVKGDRFLSKAIELSAQNSDELNVFKYAYRKDYTAKKHLVVGWTDEHVFSVSFSLNCEN